MVEAAAVVVVVVEEVPEGVLEEGPEEVTGEEEEVAEDEAEEEDVDVEMEDVDAEMECEEGACEADEVAVEEEALAADGAEGAAAQDAVKDLEETTSGPVESRTCQTTHLEARIATPTWTKKTTTP